MSNWSSTQLTDLGRALDAKVTAGTTLLSFTKMKLGSGTETAEDIPAMTDLVSPKLVLGISSCAVSASDDTICELISVASSSDVEESFVVRELGVFATDPDVGEILYAVMLDSTPDTMPNENVSSPVTVTYQVNIVSDNASSITAVIDPAGLVNVAELDAAIREHDTAPDAHAGVLLTREQVPAFNHRDVITTSGTYTAPVDGWYRITIKGGGGGGVGAEASSATAVGGAAGGEGGTSIGYEYMNAGDSATVVIGAGGVGSAIDGNNGTNGGDSSITINGATYTGGGGKGGKCTVEGGTGGAGGSGTLPGQPGGQAAATYYGGAAGASGGGSGGGVSSGNSVPIPATNGGGGAGGLGTIVSGVTYKYAGGDGGNGYAWFEYFSAI